jgi:metal-responsive CopG/Arc/MetJ family transcriptional regulator
MAKKEKTFLIRIEADLLKRLDRYSEKREYSKAEIIRIALESYIANMEEAEDKELIEQYINLRLEPKEFMKVMDFKSIPKDLQKARKEKLEEMKKVNK